MYENTWSMRNGIFSLRFFLVFGRFEEGGSFGILEGLFSNRWKRIVV